MNPQGACHGKEVRGAEFAFFKKGKTNPVTVVYYLHEAGMTSLTETHRPLLNSISTDLFGLSPIFQQAM